MLLTCRILRFTEFSFISTSGKKIREIKNKLLFPLKIKTKKNTEKNVYAAAAAKSLQSCPTLSDPMGYSLPGSSVLGIFQARVLEWGAIAISDVCIYIYIHIYIHIYTYIYICIWVCVCVYNESLCCTSETHTSKINYTSIK